MIYLDETTFNLWTPCTYLWGTSKMKFPMQINRGKSVTCIGAIDCTEGLVYYYIFEGSNNTERFVHFLEGLKKVQGVKKGKVVMDNLSIHRSKGVASFFSKQSELVPYFLSPYSSSFNPIEKLWLVLKGLWKKHLVRYAMEKFPGDRTVHDIETLLNSISDDKIKKLATSHYAALARSIRGLLV